MVGRKKKTKILSHEEDRISQLPDPLICDILCHLSTSDAVRTSVLSTRWRNLWQWVHGLDLGSYRFSNFDAVVTFVESFFDSHRESWIRKLRLDFGYGDGICDLTSWIDAVTTRRIQHLDVDCISIDMREIPLSIYTCKTLVHLQLCQVSLCNAELVSLPCLKIMDLRYNIYPNETTSQKLISGSPVMEDLTIFRSPTDDHKANVLQVCSHTLKRVYIDECTQVVIDAPLLQYLSVTVSSTKNFQIVNLGFSGKLVIDFPYFSHEPYSSSMICDILTDITRVRELVISNDFLKDIFQYSKSGPVSQFRGLSRLNVKLFKSDLEMLPTILESCPKLESFISELVRNCRIPHKNKQPKVMFSTVPRCVVSSLKFVKWKRSISWYEGEAELLRYFQKNSTILEKLRLDVYYTEKAKCDFLKELLTMPRCSSVCEIHCSLIAKR